VDEPTNDRTVRYAPPIKSLDQRNLVGPLLKGIALVEAFLGGPTELTLSELTRHRPARTAARQAAARSRTASPSSAPRAGRSAPRRRFPQVTASGRRSFTRTARTLPPSRHLPAYRANGYPQPRHTSCIIDAEPASTGPGHEGVQDPVQEPPPVRAA